MTCELCGKDIEFEQHVLSYYDMHKCITNDEVLSIYDYEFNKILHVLPMELNTTYGEKIQEFCKTFVIKESNSKNPYLLRALRNQAVNNIITDLSENIFREI